MGVGFGGKAFTVRGDVLTAGVTLCRVFLELFVSLIVWFTFSRGDNATLG